jgi:hypothetical protein
MLWRMKTMPTDIRIKLSRYGDTFSAVVFDAICFSLDSIPQTLALDPCPVKRMLQFQSHSN